MKQGLLVFLLMIFSFPVWAAPEGFDVSKPVALPEIVFQDEQGQEVKLSAFKGKVVVLNLWATWCAPCVAGLPTVDKVTSEFKDKGVVFYAVDLQENAEKVKTFIDKKAWTFPVLLDGKGETARDYRVSGIPHSVIIGTDGIIKNVHIGFGGAKALEAQLREELTAAVAAPGTD